MNSNTIQLPSLVICIVMDILGYATFAIPALGEFGDLVWAPVSAFVFYKIFGGGPRAVLGGVLNLIEEILPFTDFIPTFTISWFITQKRASSLPVKP